MARKTHKDIAEAAVKDMAVRLLDWYNKSLDMIPPTSNPASVRSVVESGVKIIGFLEPRTHQQPKADNPATDPDALKSAFGKLLKDQARGKAKQAQNPPIPQPKEQ